MSRGPLTVAMVARRVHPAFGPGGLERHVFELVTHLSQHGIEIDLFAEAPATDETRALAAVAFPSGVRPHWVSGRWLPLGRRRGTVVLDRITNYPLWSRRVAGWMLAASRHASDSRWSVVHVHGLAGWGLARAAGRGRLTSPLVLTTQGLEEFRSHLRMKRWAYGPFRAGMRKVAAESDAVVTTDVSLQPLVERYLGIPLAEQVVIPNVVDLDQCRRLGDPRRGRELLAGLGLSQASPLFLSVGRAESNKGFDLLAAALARAAPRLPNGWAWVLVGDGPARRRIEDTVVTSGLGRHCALAGQVTDGDLHSLYAVADWFVHPTLYEGSSLTTLEAMAHGLPVIASRTGGLPDKVNESVTGFLVPPGDVDALSEVLCQTRSVDGRTMGLAGQQACKACFSWDVVIPQYVALYERLVGVSAARHSVR